MAVPATAVAVARPTGGRKVIGILLVGAAVAVGLGVYGRVHALLLGAMLIAAGLLVFNPEIAGMVGVRLRAVEPLDVIVPAFLVLYMLPSVAYAWMLPHREDETVGGGSRGAALATGEAR